MLLHVSRRTSALSRSRRRSWVPRAVVYSPQGLAHPGTKTPIGGSRGRRAPPRTDLRRAPSRADRQGAAPEADPLDVGPHYVDVPIDPLVKWISGILFASAEAHRGAEGVPSCSKIAGEGTG